MGCLRYLNPGQWLTSFALWWLKLDADAVKAVKGINSGKSRTSQSAADNSPDHALLPVSPAIQHLGNNCDVAPKTDIKDSAKNEHQAIAVPGHNNHTTILSDDRYQHNRPAWQDDIRGRIFAWDFNVFELNKATHGNPLITVTLTLLETHHLLDGWKVSREKLTRYLLRVESEYTSSAYHNCIHAADVTQTAAVILNSVTQQIKDVSQMEIFCIVVAAAVHDLGHLGFNNDFLINSKHPRATRFNDKSVNEMFHISRAFEIMRESEEYNIFDGFTFDEAKRARKLMVDMVLATDMAIHFDLLKNFAAALDAQPNVADWTDRSLLFQMLVHLADIANPSRPFRLARGWAERVITEFCQQGDQEVACGLTVSPMCDRSKMNMPTAQINFIKIFLQPTLAAFEKAAPEFTRMATASLNLTIAEWKKLEESGFKMSDPIITVS